MKRTLKIAAILVLIACILLSVSCSKKTENKSLKIGVAKLLSHPALDAAEKGMADYLSEKGIDVVYD